MVHHATSIQTQVVVFHQVGFDKLADCGKIARWQGVKVQGGKVARWLMVPILKNWLMVAGNRLEKHLQKDLVAAVVLSQKSFI